MRYTGKVTDCNVVVEDLFPGLLLWFPKLFTVFPEEAEAERAYLGAGRKGQRDVMEKKRERESLCWDVGGPAVPRSLFISLAG